MEQERGSLFADLGRETWNSVTAMPRWAQGALFLGSVGFLILEAGNWPGVAHALLASLRTAAFVLLIVGLIENAMTLDEFYARVYLYACAVCVVLTALTVFVSYEWGVNLGVRALAVMSVTFTLGFLAAFAYLRRA